MATLEKIRQRKKILAIVIGAALLAFIIEVGIEAIGRSGGNSAAAKVGNEKIDIMAFQRRVEQVAAADQDNNQIDAAQRQQQVLDDMINELLLDQECEKIGLTISDREISELMIGNTPAPAVQAFVQQVGAKSAAELYDFIMNPGKQGIQEAQVAELRNEWNKLKDDVIKRYKLAKIQNLIAGCMNANDLDRAQLAEDEAVTNIVTFVKKDYASLADDKYPVSDEELKAEWQKRKPMFKTDEDVRMIHFIAVNIDPSAEDIAAANKIADAAYIALQKGRGVDSVRLMGTVHVDTAKVLQKDIPAAVRDYFASAPVGTTRRDTTTGNTHHVMYKLINKQACLDSVDLGYVVVQGDGKTQKAVLDQLNAGKSLDEIKKAYPQKVDGKLNEWQRVYNFHDTLQSKLANATIGNYFVYNSNAQGAQLLRVNERKAAKTFYTVATVTYDAYASTKTSENLRDKFQDFLNKNKTAKAFEDNAAKAGFNAAEMMITPSTPQLGANQYGGIKDSRKAIKWAFDNKKGQVSPIFSDNNNVLVAVAIDDIYEDGYLPYDFAQGKDYLTRIVRNSKKGDDLMKQYQGKAKDLNGYAALMGAQIDTAKVVFASNGDPKIGNDTGLIGRMAAAKQGQLQGPWKGQNAVYVYQLVKQEKSERKPTKEELDNRYNQSRGGQVYANPRLIYNILTKASKVKKHLIDFY